MKRCPTCHQTYTDETLLTPYDRGNFIRRDACPRRAALAPELASSLFFINEWLIFEGLSVLTLHLSKHIFSLQQTDLTSQTTRIRLAQMGYFYISSGEPSTSNWKEIEE